MGYADFTPRGQYHVGLLKAYDGPGDGKTVIVQMNRCIDCMSCELWEYLGVRVITKTAMRKTRKQLLAWINKEHGKKFERIEVW
jgi:hypothetical protein